MIDSQKQDQPFLLRRYNLGIPEIVSLGFVIKADHPSITLLKLLSNSYSHIIFSIMPFSKLDKNTESILKAVANHCKLFLVALLPDQIPFTSHKFSIFSSSEIAAVELQKSITWQRIRDDFSTVSPLKSTVSYIYGILEEEDITLDKVEKCVLKEPLLVTKIFQAVNSAENLRRNRIEQINHALAYLGIEGIKQVIAQLIFSHIVDNVIKSQRTSIQHSKCCAFIAEKVAETVYRNKALAGRVRIAALLHDLGGMALDFCFPDEMVLIVQKREFDSNILDLEKRVFGLSHCEIGALLANSWHLPDYVKESIELHHSRLTNESSTILTLVTLANHFLNKEIEKFPAIDYPIEIIRKLFPLPELDDEAALLDFKETLTSFWLKFDLHPG